MRLPRWLTSFLGVPLAIKIAGANGVIVVAALTAAIAIDDGSPGQSHLLLVLGIAISLSLIVNVGLVLLALQPLEDLEMTAIRIWRGDLGARVPYSPLADSDLKRVGGALNVLLEGLTSDRTRMRALAAQVIRAGDAERAAVARELHDSTAQTMAALVMELSVAATEQGDVAARARIDRMRRIASDVLDEVKLLAHAVHPRVLDDLGLAPALEQLTRETRERGTVAISFDAGASSETIPRAYASVLYRIAQEALSNAMRHAAPRSVVVRLGTTGGVSRLQVTDDGSGFDVAEAERRRPGMGLFSMRERAALVGGTLGVRSVRGEGTTITATIPLTRDDQEAEGIVATVGTAPGSAGLDQSTGDGR